jgi:adenylyltransferase/sulfurtransferase
MSHTDAPPILSVEELERYDRQLMLDEIGPSGQAQLKMAKVLIVGAGGLGSTIALQLAAAGVGNLVIIDHDRVSLSNLNRQILHAMPDLDKFKVDSAKETLGQLNPHVHIETVTDSINEQNAAQLAAGCDLIIDALDNLPTRMILNLLAIDLKIPFVHGAVNGFDGRALTILPGKSACLQCMQRGPSKPAEAKFPVLGAAPALIGAVQATEAIKCLLGIGEPLAGRLIQYDGLAMAWKEYHVKMNPNCSHCSHLQHKEK